MSGIRRRPEDPVTLASAVWTGLHRHQRARPTVRHEPVTTLIADLHDTLTNTRTSDSEAYEAFVRTVALLNVYVEEKRR